MNILGKLNSKNFKLNKKRNIVTIIGITLSVALITCVATMYTSILETAKISIINSRGNYHIATNKSAIFAQIQNDANTTGHFKVYKIKPPIDKASTTQTDDIESDTTTPKRSDTLYATDKTGFEKSSARLTKGRFPTSEDEVIANENAISKHVKQDPAFLSMSDGYKEGDAITLSQPIAKTYKIVGIYETTNSIFGNYRTHNNFITIKNEDLKESPENTTLYYLIKNPKTVNEHLKKYYENTKNSTPEKSGGLIQKNDSLLKLYGTGLNDETGRVFAIFASVVIFIIIITSVLVIKNSFSISITEKTKEFGILKSLGATTRQIRYLITLEGCTLGFFGVLFGLILGISVSYLLVFIVNLLIGDFIDANSKLVAKVSFFGIAVAITLSLATIYLSIISIVHRAKKISAISAIRSTDDIKISSKKMKTSKIIVKIFGIGGVISHKNLKRNRKKYRTTVVSLVISVTAFISINYIVGTMLKSVQVNIGKVNYNYGLMLPNLSENAANIKGSSPALQKTKNLAKQVSEKFLNNSEHVITYPVYVDIKSSSINNDALKYLNRSANYHGISIYSANVALLDDSSFDRLLKQNHLDASTKVLAAEKILCQNYKKEKTYSPLLSADTIEYREVKSGDAFKTVKAAKIKKLPLGFSEDTNMSSSMFFARSSDPDFSSMSDRYTGMSVYANVKNVKQTEKEVSEFLKTEGRLKKHQFFHFAESIRAVYSYMLIIQIFGYGFIAVITLIGLTNIFNTIHTSMLLRSREFAALRSIGITNRELNRIVALESLFYGAKSLIIGILFGTGVTYWLYQATRESTATIKAPFEPPYIAIAISIAFVFTIVYAIMRYSIKILNKQNIIETIRNENI